jgi:hypothetical protein
LRLFGRKQPKTGYWINGWGPFDTEEERDDWHESLRQLAEHNRQFRADLEADPAWNEFEPGFWRKSSA